MVHENAHAGRLQFSTDIREGVEFGDVLFIAVGTPPDEDGSADLQYILQVATSIGQHINEYRVVVNKSTVPVGTAEKVDNVIRQQLEARGVRFHSVWCRIPNFSKKGLQ